MAYLKIDGAQGEGGGQVLRTALTLSMLTNTNIEVTNIRARRNKPGLLRQHLTSVMAASEISQASTQGVELGSTAIRFAPKQIKAGDYRFVIGTAGSTVLVCQTVLLALALADSSSTVRFEGGTHNGMSPSLCFFEQSFLPILRMLGVRCELQVTSLGFYPAGGGKWQIHIQPTASLSPLDFTESRTLFGERGAACQAKALLSDLPESIGERELATAKKALGWDLAESSLHDVPSPGSGNSLQLMLPASTHINMFEQFGQLGVSAERVAKRCAGNVKRFVKAHVNVEEFLADQLLIPMALAGKGSFSTTKPSLHTLTNIAVIEQFLDVNFTVEQENDLRWCIGV